MALTTLPCATALACDLVAIHTNKLSIKYDEPIYLGMCILDISKTVIHNFHYNYIKLKYHDRVKPLMTDTDSLVYELKTDDFYLDIENDIETRFYTSNYPSNHPSGIKSGATQKVNGTMKDECAGRQISV
jgi:hypothetical protein